MSFFYLRAVWSYIAQMIPCMLLAAGIFFLLRPWRRRRLSNRGLSSSPHREAALLLFLLFCAGLGALTLFPQGFWRWDSLYAMLQGEQVFAPVDLAFQLQRTQWIPFQNLLSGHSGWEIFMLLGNIIMFLPLGFFTALLWRDPSWLKSLLAGFSFSLFVEVIQFFIGRSSDVNDVLLNSLGALCGFWLFCLLRWHAPHMIQNFQCIRLEAPYGREIGDPTASS